MNPLKDRHIVVGLGGGIACYKTPEIVRALLKQGATVRAAPTRSALAFITPLTLEALSARPILTDVLAGEQGRIMHIEETAKTAAFVIAPATANLMARLAAGFADEALTAMLLVSRVPLILAPAMETHMWTHPATQANLRTLQERGAIVVGPDDGPLASGRTGPGRMAKPEAVVEAVAAALTPKDLAGTVILVTAGPTHEDIDPVRFIANRSTGRMGVALAVRAARRGARVRLAHGPLGIPIPRTEHIQCLPVRSAREMRDAAMDGIETADAAFLCAAVADFAPARRAEEKLKKGDSEFMTLDLTRAPDILAELGARSARPWLAGFAAETEELDLNAREKLSRKGCDLICANDVTRPDSGFGTDTNRLTLFRRDGSKEALPLMDKGDAADRVLDEYVRARAAEAKK